MEWIVLGCPSCWSYRRIIPYLSSSSVGQHDQPGASSQSSEVRSCVRQSRPDSNRRFRLERPASWASGRRDQGLRTHQVTAHGKASPTSGNLRLREPDTGPTASNLQGGRGSKGPLSLLNATKPGYGSTSLRFEVVTVVRCSSGRRFLTSPTRPWIRTVGG